MATWQSFQIFQIDVGVVDETVTPPKVYKLMFSIDTLCYNCYFCNSSAISAGFLHRFVSLDTQKQKDDLDKLINEFQNEGVRCFTCKRPLALILIKNNQPTPQFFWKSQATKVLGHELWYEWQGQYYARSSDVYACPICERQFEYSDQCCTHCGAQLGDERKIFATLYSDRWEINMARTNHDGKWYGTVTLTWNPVIGAYNLKFNDFVTKELIDLLKLAIPSSDRSYEAKTKVWTFTENHYDFIFHLVDNKYTKVITYTKEKIEEEYKKFQNTAAPVDPKTQLGIFVKLVTAAGITMGMGEKDGKVARKAYLRAAMYYHPDRNPERAKDMSALNEAWTNLQEYFGLRGVTA